MTDPEPGVMHPIDQAFYDETVAQRNRAWLRITKLEQQLRDAIELAEEGWGYASPYFREKWGYEERIKAIREVVG